MVVSHMSHYINIMCIRADGVGNGRENLALPSSPHSSPGSPRYQQLRYANYIMLRNW